MKQVFSILVLIILFSCNKEKQKTKWEFIPVMDKESSLIDYEITNLWITDNGKASFMISEKHGTTSQSIYHSTNDGESWIKLVSDNDLPAHQFTSLSYLDNHVYIISYSNENLSHSLFTYNIASGTLTEKELPASLSDVNGDRHPKIQFIDDATGFIGFRGIWKTLDTGNTWTREYPFGDIILSMDHVDDNESFALVKEHCIHTSNQWEDWDTVFSSYGGDFKQIQMVNQTTGIIRGRQLWLTKDAGKNWDIILDETILDASINDKGEVYVVSTDKGMARSINYGETWSKRTDKKDGFTSVYTTNNNTLAGITNKFKDSDKTEKDGIIIGRLKN